MSKYVDYNNLKIKDKALLVSKLLSKDYPTAETPLIHKNEFELLISVILSPQTKDETTNKVTPVLFQKYPTSKELAQADVKEIEKIIKLVNYYKTKAQRLPKVAQILISEFDSKVPYRMEDLLKLPGVGRKVANVVINEWFVKNKVKDVSGNLIQPVGFVVDTHVLRISKKLGLTNFSDPKKVEQDLLKIFPQDLWVEISLRMIFHGREYSQAKKPQFHKHEEWSQIYKSLGF
jgi:endonuclease-3